MKKFITILVLIVSVWTGQGQASTIGAEPYKLVKVISEKLVNELATVAKDEKQKEQMKRIVNEVIFPHIDTKYVAYSVLGKYLKTTSKEQRDAFTSAFSYYLVNTYSLALEQFNDQKIQVLPNRSNIENKSKVAIKAQVIDAKRPAIDVFFKLRKNKKTGQWLMYDLVAEGVSVLHSKRSELAKMIKQQGVAATTEYLIQNS